MLEVVRRLADPYSNFLDPVPRPAAVVCPVCRTTRDPRYATCVRCSDAVAAFGDGVADLVVPIALSVKGGQLAYELRAYKDALPAAARAPLQRRLTAVLWRFLDAHERCLEQALGTSFTVVTVIPSCQGRPGAHPLEQIVASRIRPTATRFRPLLVPTEPRGQEHGQEHEFRADRFVVAQRVSDPVLVIDDTWTTGSRMQAAAWNLKAAGAPIVAAAVIGRHFDPEYRDNQAFLRLLQASVRLVHLLP